MTKHAKSLADELDSANWRRTFKSLRFDLETLELNSLVPPFAASALAQFGVPEIWDNCWANYFDLGIAFGITDRNVNSTYVFLVDGGISEYPGNSDSCLTARGRQVAFAGELMRDGINFRSKFLIDPMRTIEAMGAVHVQTDSTAETTRAVFRIADGSLELLFAPPGKLDHLIVSEAVDR